MTSGPTFGTRTKPRDASGGATGHEGSAHHDDAVHVSLKGLTSAPDGMQYTVIVAVRGSGPSKEFLMVRHKERGWELPGGKIESHEGPVHCALREFREETGHLLALPHFVVKLRKPNGTCYVFTGALGAKVDEVDQGDKVGEMRWFGKLPRGEGLAFPDDPYPEMGKLLDIDFG